jgi:hypothetical protein
MASYHCRVKVGRKGAAAPHSDYIAREDKYANMKSKSDLEHKEYGNMPTWAAHDPKEFWKSSDNFERSNGSTYREIEIALPRELNHSQRIELVNDFIKSEFGDRHAYQYAIHNPKASIEKHDQPHAHIMYSERVNDGLERNPQQYFKRANNKHPERGGAKKASKPQTYTERKQSLVALRSRWADIQNKHLEKNGFKETVDHRSLEERGIGRTPEKHLGAKRINALQPSQLIDIIDKRAAERELEVAEKERASIIDLSMSLKDAIAERDRNAKTSDVTTPKQEEISLSDVDFDSMLNDADAEILTEINFLKELEEAREAAEREAQKQLLQETQQAKEKSKNRGWSL